MHATTIIALKHAVVRSFEPTRIERELLARVFELAGRECRLSEIDDTQAIDLTAHRDPTAPATEIQLDDVGHPLERAA